MSLGGPSFWLETTPETDYPKLADDISVDVAVVGAGITGITAAVLLKRAGRTVALIDSKRIVHGATGYTTAKVTSGHGSSYRSIRQAFGEDGARIYAEANEAAMARIAQFVAEDGIECDFERKPNYVYAESAEEVAQLRQETEVERKAGLAASLVDETPLPFAVPAALRLENQAQFHPRKYLLALAATIPGDGSHVFEQSRVDSVKHGQPLRGCGRPAHRPGKRRHTRDPPADPRRRPLLHEDVSPPELRGCRADRRRPRPRPHVHQRRDPTRSIRTLRDGERDFIQVGGNGHKTGEEDDTPTRYDQLEGFLREHWPGAGEVAYRWSTQDYMAHDRVPFVGRLRRRSEHLLTATGYSKWGMTNGTVAAMILADSILGRRNPWAALYDSKRPIRRSALGSFLKENISAGLHFVGDRLSGTDRTTVEELKPGEGAVIRVRGRRTAVYRDEQGALHGLSPVCRHLYCLVDWNPAERSWDCHATARATAATGARSRGRRRRT